MAYVHFTAELISVLNENIYALYIVKYLPSWMPGTSFFQTAEKGRKLAHDEQWMPYNDAKARYVSICYPAP